MPDARRRVLILNAGLNGKGGNTHAVLERASKHLEPHVDVTMMHLALEPRYATFRPELARADALIVGTGTHWDSWSHLLQRLLEEATPDEGTPLWLGKPAAAFVTMHAVGGKAVLSRLQGVLNTFGCTIPPMSGMVYSLANQAAVAAAVPGSEDLWSVEDVAVVCHNLLVPLGVTYGFRAWHVDRERFGSKWIQ